MLEQKGSWFSRWAVSIGDGINHLLWPAVCISCREVVEFGEDNLCTSCRDDLSVSMSSDYCRRCGRDVSRYALVEGRCPLCESEEIVFDSIARVGVYSGTLRGMILSFKTGRVELKEEVGFLANRALEGSDFFDQIDFFVPVPLHWTRRFVRGYNQSLILARQLKHPTAKINTELVRIRRTKSQASMATARERARNVEGAFAVRWGHKLGGARVCLVDDIKTTGATLNECAKTLKQADVSKVFALVLGLAGQNAV